MTDTAGSDAQGAARALRAVLAHPKLAPTVDERLLESLLRHALAAIPRLGNALFHCGDLEYELGRRGQADLVGRSQGLVALECEVKIHSKLNWAKPGQWQLDEYADRAPATARLFLLTAQRRLASLTAELEDKQVRSRSRWTLLHLDEVRDALDAIDAPRAQPGGMIETLICALARLEAA